MILLLLPFCICVCAAFFFFLCSGWFWCRLRFPLPLCFPSVYWVIDGFLHSGKKRETKSTLSYTHWFFFYCLFFIFVYLFCSAYDTIRSLHFSLCFLFLGCKKVWFAVLCSYMGFASDFFYLYTCSNYCIRFAAYLLFRFCIAVGTCSPALPSLPSRFL